MEESEELNLTFSTQFAAIILLTARSHDRRAGFGGPPTRWNVNPKPRARLQALALGDYGVELKL